MINSQVFLRSIVATGIALGAGLFSPAGAGAEPATATPWVETEQTAVRLVSASRAVGQSDSLRLGLQFKLKPGWKVYWRSPGDAGFPPRLDWNKSYNLGRATIDWPAPTRFSVLGFETQGYKKEVVFPITARPAVKGEPMQLRARLDYLACDEVSASMK